MGWVALGMGGVGWWWVGGSGWGWAGLRLGWHCLRTRTTEVENIVYLYEHLHLKAARTKTSTTGFCAAYLDLIPYRCCELSRANSGWAVHNDQFIAHLNTSSRASAARSYGTICLSRAKRSSSG